MRRFIFQAYLERTPGLPIPQGSDGFISRQPLGLVLPLEK